MSNKIKKPIEWIEKENGCFECINRYKDKRGYATIQVNNKKTRVHRFIYEECFGFIPEGMVVRHKCDNTSCINPEHLELGTPKDNSQDMVKRGRVKVRKGVKHPHSKITEEQVKEIRLSKETNRVLAKKYGISNGQICQIKNYKWWKEVK